MAEFDFEDIPKGAIAVGVLALLGAVNLFFVKDQLGAQMAHSQTDAAVQAAAQRAETACFQPGSEVGGLNPAPEQFNCIAQALSARGNSNFVLGDIVIDPKSITPENPQGTPINGGFVASSDGSVVRVQEGRVVEVLGTSAKIRRYLVEQGHAIAAVQMKRQTIQEHGGN